MSFLKNILGAFVEFKPEDPTKAKKKVDTTGKIEPAIAERKPSTSNTETWVAGEPDRTASSGTQYEKHFAELIEEANSRNPVFQGTDFKEFIDSKSDVEGIADEATRYRTAFNVLKRTGLTKDKLVKTGHEYLNIIDEDMKAFENVYLDQYKNQVEQKEQQLQQKGQELQALTQKMELLNKEMKQMSGEVLANKERLNLNKAAFITAGQNIKNDIETELKKIDEYFS